MKTLMHLSTIKPLVSKSLIKGTTTKEGAPISCPVRAYNRKTGELLSSTVSNNDGSYILFGSHTSPNTVVAIDPDETFNAATQDMVE